MHQNVSVRILVRLSVLLLSLEFKETVGLLTKPKRSIQ